MKTKHLLYTLTFACMSWSATSCVDILDVAPMSSFSDEAVWSDLALSETYLNAQYANLWAESMKGTRFAHFTDEVLWFRECYTRIAELRYVCHRLG